MVGLEMTWSSIKPCLWDKMGLYRISTTTAITQKTGPRNEGRTIIVRKQNRRRQLSPIENVNKEGGILLAQLERSDDNSGDDQLGSSIATLQRAIFQSHNINQERDGRSTRQKQNMRHIQTKKTLINFEFKSTDISDVCEADL